MQITKIPDGRLKCDRSHKCGDNFAEYSIDKKFFLCSYCMVRRLYRELINEWDRKEILRECVEHLYLNTVIFEDHKLDVQDALKSAFSEHPTTKGREETERMVIKESFDVEI